MGPTYTTPEVVAWLFTSIAIVLSVGRYFIRYSYNNVFTISDVFHVVSVVLLVVFTILYTLELPRDNKFSFPDPENPVTKTDERLQQQASITESCIWFVALYSVKFSFLFFYRSLFGVQKSFMVAWWFVGAFTFLCFWASIGMVLASCGGQARNLYNPDICYSATNKRLYVKILEMFCATDVLTDLAVMALPIWVIRKIQIPLRTKVSLGFLFSLASISIIFDIVRTVFQVTGEAKSFYYTSTLFSNLELEIAVIISALLPYRSLLGHENIRHISFRNLLSGNWTARRLSNDTEPEHGELDTIGGTHIPMSNYKKSGFVEGNSGPCEATEVGHHRSVDF